MDEVAGLLETYRLGKHEENKAAALKGLLRIVGPPVKHFILRRCPQGRVSDVFQTSMEAMFDGLHKFRGNTKPELVGWCITITNRRLADTLKEDARLLLFEPDGINQLLEASAADEGLSQAERMDSELAWQVFRGLAEKCRNFLWLKYVDRLDYQTIAEVTKSTSADAVRKASSRCLEQAQEAFATKERTI